MVYVIYFLVWFMVFVGNQDDVVGVGMFYCQVDCMCVVVLYGYGIGVLEVGQDVGYDYVVVFVMWVVVGDDDLVGQVFGNCCYLWMFVGIVFVIIVEYVEQCVLQMVVQVVQCLFQCVWGMCVVDYYGWQVVFVVEVVYVVMDWLQC